MIVEFMQDEYKNLWLSNCYYISSQKIEGMTEIEAIYLKRMSLKWSTRKIQSIQKMKLFYN